MDNAPFHGRAPGPSYLLNFAQVLIQRLLARESKHQIQTVPPSLGPLALLLGSALVQWLLWALLSIPWRALAQLQQLSPALGGIAREVCSAHPWECLDVALSALG